MPRGLLMAARAGNRMEARQSYRTFNRMERRRARFAGAPAGPEQEPAAPAPPAEPGYVVELERLAQLHAQGVVTDTEYEAKKRQLLGL